MSTSKIVLFFFLLCVFSVMTAQYATSPYSSFGIGEIVKKGNGQSAGMGGISYGLRTFNQVNYLNPASYTAQDTGSFMMDVSLIGNINTYGAHGLESQSGNFTINNFIIGFPITHRWKSSIGLIPYSRVGYNLQEERQEADTLVNYHYQGVGGVNQLYFGHSFMFFDKLAVGVNVSYLFGFISHNKEMYVVGDQNAGKIRESDKNVYGDVALGFGMQFFDTLKLFNNKFVYTIGAVYDNQSNISTRNTFTKERILQAGSNIQLRDTVLYTDNVKKVIQFPTNMGVGFTIEQINKWTFGADYSMTNWGDVNQDHLNFQHFANSQRFNAGIEYIPEKHSFRNYWKRVHYRVGGHWAQHHLSFDNNQLQDKSLSVGLGLPFRYSNTTFNLTYERGLRSGSGEGVIREDYNIFMVNLTFFDFWFFKRKIE